MSIRILVVDDEVALQEICRHHLTKAGYEVETASSGEEAVEKVAQTSFDLALMDYRLPGINGIEAFRQMREVRPGILGIIITGFGTMDVAVDALNQGFSAYLAKPVRREMLLNTVREVLARRQLELEKHRLEMLTHLYQEMEALLRCTDENTLSRTALDLLVRETHSDGGALIIREGDSWQVKASIGELDYEHLPQVVQRVIETGKRINLHGGPDANPAYADALRALNAQAYLALPIRVDGEPIGAMIVFQRDESAEYPESAVEHWSLISIYMGVLLERLRAMHEQHQVEQLATIGRMAAAIIHDLKNPISGIVGAAEIIEDMTPEAREMTRIIIREAQRLTDMVEEVLAYARGITEFHPEKLLVEEFVHDVLETAQYGLEDENIQLHVELKYTGEVELDPIRMRRALLNLISNARDAMPEGGRLTIRVERVGDEIGFTVEDTGIGMPPEVKERLFEPFFTHGKTHGTGLGTAIVKSIVEAHGGRIEVDSEVGKGTRITLWLPVYQVAPAQGSEADAEHTAVGAFSAPNAIADSDS